MRNPPPQPAYYQTRRFTATLGDRPINFVSKPGLPSWDRVSAASTLLAEAVSLAADARVLLLGCGHGALAVALARLAPRGEVWLADTSCIALSMAERTLEANQIENAHVLAGISVLPGEAGAFDVVVVELPSGRKLARRWLVEAFNALGPGGTLYLAGPNTEGIQAVVGDAEALFGNSRLLGYKHKNRVASMIKSGSAEATPSWASEPGIAPGTWYEFEVDIRGHVFAIHSLPGIFSYDRLDEGTSLLLSHLNVRPGSRVLDIGCGYGIIGLVAARLGAGTVDMSDVNLLAVAAAQRNIAAHSLGGAQAFPSDAFSAVPRDQYDLIVTNPPFHSGKSVDYEMAQAFIAHANTFLKPGGQFALVANRFIPYEQSMREMFRTVETVARTGRYQMLLATRE